jgi:hypothetical protein
MEPPPGGILRKNIILNMLQAPTIQEFDSKWFTGAESIRRTPDAKTVRYFLVFATHL